MRLHLFLLFTLITSVSFSQSKEFTTAELKSFSADLSIYKPLPDNYKLPFSSIQIIDSRPDTTKIGFIRLNPNKDGKNAFKKIVVQNGLTQSLKSILNEHYKPCFSNDSLQLLIVIKRFWADPYPNRLVQQQGNVVRSSVFDMYLRFEFFFVKNDWFYPVKRIDTLFQTGEGEVVPGCNYRKIQDCEMYGYAVSKVFEGTDFDYYVSRIDRAKNKVTKQGLDSFNKKYKDYPIISTKVLKQGVYLNFNEFRNNMPSVTKYTVEKIKKHKITMYAIYDTSKVVPERIAKYWGYCNGKNIYCGYLQHPLTKSGDTFEFFIDKKEYNEQHISVPLPNSYGTGYSFLDIPISTSLKSLEPFQIDMETGKIY
jgi:hypothetical protein